MLEGRVMSGVSINLSKNFETVTHNNFLDKLKNYLIDKWTVRRTENQLNFHTQRIVSAAWPNRRSDTSGIP